MSDNDEKTIVLDLDKLKRELNIGNQANETDDSGVIEQTIDFGGSSPETTQEKESQPNQIPDNTPGIEATEIFSMEDMEIELSESPASKPEPQKAPLTKVLLFDYKSNYFKSAITNLGEETLIVTNLSELNQYIKEREEKILVFNYLVQPNTVNKLMHQLNKKFSHITSVIIGKKFSPKRVQMHQSSPYGAKIYIDIDDSKDLIADIRNKYQATNLKKTA